MRRLLRQISIGGYPRGGGAWIPASTLECNPTARWLEANGLIYRFAVTGPARVSWHEKPVRWIYWHITDKGKAELKK